MDCFRARITLAVDAMGGDLGPSEVLAGLVKASSFVPGDLKYLLFGREEELNVLVEQNADLKRLDLEVRHADEVVGMEDKPIAGIKNKKNSSMVRALQSLKDEEADAMLCCGNTGCLMAGGTIKLRTLEGSKGLRFAQFGQDESVISLFWMQGPILIPSLTISCRMLYWDRIMPA